MPYIDPDRQARLDDKRCDPETISDLDYEFACLINAFLLRHGLSFDKVASVIAALETTKLEVYRRFAWYEETKRRENGDPLYALGQSRIDGASVLKPAPISGGSEPEVLGWEGSN